MTRIAAMIATAAGALVATAGLALAESPYGMHDYWSRVERAQECAWGGGRAYTWGAPEYPCWNRAPPAGHYGSSAPPLGYYGGWQRPYGDGPQGYGYGWR
jgi:hypothetical protein